MSIVYADWSTHTFLQCWLRSTSGLKYRYYRIEKCKKGEVLSKVGGRLPYYAKRSVPGCLCVYLWVGAIHSPRQNSYQGTCTGVSTCLPSILLYVQVWLSPSVSLLRSLFCQEWCLSSSCAVILHLPRGCQFVGVLWETKFSILTQNYCETSLVRLPWITSPSCNKCYDIVVSVLKGAFVLPSRSLVASWYS